MTQDPHNTTIADRDLHFLRTLLSAGNYSAATTYYAGLKNCTLSEARAALKALQITKTPPSNGAPKNGST